MLFKQSALEQRLFLLGSKCLSFLKLYSNKNSDAYVLLFCRNYEIILDADEFGFRELFFLIGKNNMYKYMRLELFLLYASFTIC